MWKCWNIFGMNCIGYKYMIGGPCNAQCACDFTVVTNILLSIISFGAAFTHFSWWGRQSTGPLHSFQHIGLCKKTKTFFLCTRATSDFIAHNLILKWFLAQLEAYIMLRASKVGLHFADKEVNINTQKKRHPDLTGKRVYSKGHNLREG